MHPSAFRSRREQPRHSPWNKRHQAKSRHRSSVAEAPVPALARFSLSPSPPSPLGSRRIRRATRLSGSSPSGAVPRKRKCDSSLSESVSRWPRNPGKSLSFNFCRPSSASPLAGGSAERKVRDEHHVRGHTAHRLHFRVHGSSRGG